MNAAYFCGTLAEAESKLWRLVYTLRQVFPAIETLEQATAFYFAEPYLIFEENVFYLNANAYGAMNLLIGDSCTWNRNIIDKSAIQRAFRAFSVIEQLDVFQVLTNYVGLQICYGYAFFESDEQLIAFLESYFGPLEHFVDKGILANFELQSPTNCFPYIRKRYKLRNSAALYYALLLDVERCRDVFSGRFTLQLLQLEVCSKEERMVRLAEMLKEVNQVAPMQCRSLIDFVNGARESLPATAFEQCVDAQLADLHGVSRLITGNALFQPCLARQTIENLCRYLGVEFAIKTAIQEGESVFARLKGAIQYVKSYINVYIPEMDMQAFWETTECFYISAIRMPALQFWRAALQSNEPYMLTCNSLSEVYPYITINQMPALFPRVYAFLGFYNLELKDFSNQEVEMLAYLTGIEASDLYYLANLLERTLGGLDDTPIVKAALEATRALLAESAKKLYKRDYGAIYNAFLKLLACGKAATVENPSADSFLSALAMSTDFKAVLREAQFYFYRLTGYKSVIYCYYPWQADCIAYNAVFDNINRTECTRLLALYGIDCAPPYIGLEFLQLARGVCIQTCFGLHEVKRVYQSINYLAKRNLLYYYEQNSHKCAASIMAGDDTDFSDALEKCRHQCRSDYVLWQLRNINSAYDASADKYILLLYVKMLLITGSYDSDLSKFSDVSIAEQARLTLNSTEPWLII